MIYFINFNANFLQNKRIKARKPVIVIYPLFFQIWKKYLMKKLHVRRSL